MSEEQFLKTAKELNIDLSKFTGQAAIDPSLTGGPPGFTLGDVPPAQTGGAGAPKLATKQLKEIRTAVQQWFAGEGIFKFVAGPEGGSFQLDLPVGKKGEARARKQLAEALEVEKRVQNRVNELIQNAGPGFVVPNIAQITSDVIKEVNPQRWQNLQFTPTVIPTKKEPPKESVTPAVEAFTSKTKVTVPLPKFTKFSDVSVSDVIKRLESMPDAESAGKLLGEIKKEDPDLYKRVVDKITTK